MAIDNPTMKVGGGTVVPPSGYKTLRLDSAGNPLLLGSDGNDAPVSGPSTAWIDQRMIAIKKIAPTLTRPRVFDCTSLGTGADVKSIAGAGATATVTMSAAGVDGAGILIDTVSTASSYRPVVHRDYDGSGSPPTSTPAYFLNPKTKPWAIVTRINIQTAPTADENIALGCIESLDVTKLVIGGILGGTDRTKLGLLVVGGANTSFTSNLAIPPVGEYHDVAFVFDAGAVNGTPTIWILLDDVRSSTGLTDLTNLMTVAAQPGRIYYNNSSTTVSKKLLLTNYAVVTPGPLRPDGG